MNRARHTLALSTLLLALAACGGDSGTESGGGTVPADRTSEAADEPAADERPSDDPALVDPLDSPAEVDPGTATDPLIESAACSLLDASWLTSNISFEFGDSVWEERPDTSNPNRCRWFNESKLLTLSVDIDTPAGSNIDDRRDNPPSTGTNHDLDFADGAFAVRDDFGERYYQAWMPVGEVVVSLVADVMHIDDAQFVAASREVYTRAGG
jgi:hypothetical protein